MHLGEGDEEEEDSGCAPITTSNIHGVQCMSIDLDMEAGLGFERPLRHGDEC